MNRCHIWHVVVFVKVQISIFHIKKWDTSPYFRLQIILILDVQAMSMAYVFRKYIFCFFYCY